MDPIMRQPTSGIGMQTQPAQPSLRQNLEQQKKALTERLALVDAALSELDANPGVAAAFEAVSKVLY